MTEKYVCVHARCGICMLYLCTYMCVRNIDWMDGTSERLKCSIYRREWCSQCMYCTSSAPYETIPLRQNFAQGDIWGKYLFQVKERERESKKKRMRRSERDRETLSKCRTGEAMRRWKWKTIKKVKLRLWWKIREPVKCVNKNGHRNVVRYIGGPGSPIMIFKVIYTEHLHLSIHCAINDWHNKLKIHQIVNNFLVYIVSFARWTKWNDKYRFRETLFIWYSQTTNSNGQ